jgi:hypothetical protein
MPNPFTSLPKMKMTERFDHDREEILKEMREAPALLAFYITQKGDNRAVFTDLCVPLFQFLLVILSRNILVFEFIKKAIECIELFRNDDPKAQQAFLEAVEYINLKTNNKN